MTVPTVFPLSPYPSARARQALAPSKLSALNRTVASTLRQTLVLPPSARDTPAARSFLRSYASDAATQALHDLVWGTSTAPTSTSAVEKSIHRNVLLLAGKLAEIDLQTLVDLSVVYARNHASRVKSIFSSAHASILSGINDELVPAFTRLLSTQGIYAIRKVAHVVKSFVASCTPEAARCFAHNKPFILALSRAYGSGLSDIARSYGGEQIITAQVSLPEGQTQPRALDDWERLWLETKVDLIDTFHVILKTLVDDITNAKGRALAEESERVFDIVFSLRDMDTSSTSGSTTPFVNSSLLDDYSRTYDLSRTLGAALQRASEKDARLDLLESSLKAPERDGADREGALKLLLRSSGINSNHPRPQHIRHSGEGKDKGKGKAKARSSPEPPQTADDPILLSQISQIHDMLPHISESYIRALLLAPDSYPFSGNVERVIDALLNGSAPPEDDILPRHVTEVTGGYVEEAETYDVTIGNRANVFDEDEMDLNLVRKGKATVDEDILVRDRTFDEKMKADILRLAEAIALQDDEEEEEEILAPNANAKGKGKSTSTRAVTLAYEDELDESVHGVVDGEAESDTDDENDDEESDGEEGGGAPRSPETILELAYIANSKVFDRDSATRRSKERIALKAQTGEYPGIRAFDVLVYTTFDANGCGAVGWDDNQIEGWGIMLERNPKKAQILQKHEFAGNKPIANADASVSHSHQDVDAGDNQSPWYHYSICTSSVEKGTGQGAQHFQHGLYPFIMLTIPRSRYDKLYNMFFNVESGGSSAFDFDIPICPFLMSMVYSAADILAPNTAMGAAYNSYARPPCSPNTRTDVLKEISTWVTENSKEGSKKPVYWLHGPTGTGKTTIAQSVALECAKRKILGASFFFSGSDNERNNAGRVVTTLAYQLCLQSKDQDYRTRCAVDKQPAVERQSMGDQVQQLIIETLANVKNFQRIVVLDSLDQCSDDDVLELVPLLFKAASSTPLSFFITSRLTPSVVSLLQKHAAHVDPVDLLAHDARDDIRLFCLSNFLKIGERRGLKDRWFSEDDLMRMVDLTGGIFLYAATAARFIANSKLQDGQTQLRALLSSQHNQAGGAYGRLYTLYGHILASIPKETYQGLTRRVIGTICLASYPLALPTSDRILGFTPGESWRCLQDLRAIFQVPSSQNDKAGCVTLLHNFFIDYITTPSRSGRFAINVKAHHSYLICKCLDLMVAGLRRNICDLPPSGDRNNYVRRMIAKKRAQNIDGGLEYGCRSWHYHLANGAITKEVLERLRVFSQATLIYWVEAMSILARVDDILISLQTVLSTPNLPNFLVERCKELELAVGNETIKVGDWPLNIYKACDPPLAKAAKALPPTPPLPTPPLPRDEPLPTIKGLFSSMPVPQPAVGGAEADALSLSDTIQRCELLQPPEPTRSEQIQNPTLPEAPPFSGISQEGGGYFACAFCMEEVGNEIIEGTFRNEPLIIVAMYEHLAALWGGAPNPYHFSLYSQWARGGWGMVLTGNFQVSGKHLTLGRDVVIPQQITDASLKPFIQLADAMHGSERSLAIMQLSHAGRQSANFIGGRWPFAPPRAPSPVRVGSSSSAGFFVDVFHWLCFQTPDPLTPAEIDDVVEAFVRGAHVAAQSGFDGVELHAAHGYLLAQFLSPKRILSRIREEAPPQFIVGIKLNAGDYATSGSEDCALEHVRKLVASRLVDFIEISGGDYENPGQLFNTILLRVTNSNHPIEFTSTSTSPRQALFTRFSREALLAVASTVANPPLILLTGGFSSPAQLNTALDSKHADLLGIGRFSIICPDLPLTLRQNAHPPNSYFSSRPSIESADPMESNSAFAWLWKQIKQIKLIGAGTGNAWYKLALRELAERHTSVTVPKSMGVLRAVGGKYSNGAFGSDMAPFVRALACLAIPAVTNVYGATIGNKCRSAHCQQVVFSRAQLLESLDLSYEVGSNEEKYFCNGDDEAANKQHEP
ncbi:hypothetical protein EYR36_002617 [Pleurotus pulmonarius]|nr:hypothetical protein EYR36_002617 [Pleurotus pulmonarius]